ncbi:universal stress protein [Leptothoe sp. PORK10 BA2]|uniref:universal stress protein n=1 Tax=Leptothoe sp. PORK10 BA2 TaxID=3110254 RepID=UPI002B216F69|nr:universal stress protein [Leptothoe sp. PORK10 BA2]MEA5463938.1 universal stress protein [Leptothoe sp. PORK10 BA2]
MLKRILVAYDRSEMAEQALEQASSLAKFQSAKLRLVHVLCEGEPGSPPKLYFNDRQHIAQPSGFVMGQYEKDWNHFVDDWWKRLEWIVRKAKADGLEASCDLYQGRAGRQLCQAAKDWHADLIVMGYRGLTQAQEMMVGSVSHYVNHRAPCSSNYKFKSYQLIQKLSTS